MNIYDIDKAILNCIDTETGEILDFDAIDALQMERTAKIENVACWCKDLAASAKALKEEEAALHERRLAADAKADSLKKYLAYALNGEKFETAKARISYRNSEAVVIADEAAFVEWAETSAPDLLTYSAPKPSKTAIKDALKDGMEIAGAEIVKNQSLQIK